MIYLCVRYRAALSALLLMFLILCAFGHFLFCYKVQCMYLGSEVSMLLVAWLICFISGSYTSIQRRWRALSNANSVLLPAYKKHIHHEVGVVWICSHVLLNLFAPVFDCYFNCSRSLPLYVFFCYLFWMIIIWILLCTLWIKQLLQLEYAKLVFFFFQSAALKHTKSKYTKILMICQ